MNVNKCHHYHGMVTHRPNYSYESVGDTQPTVAPMLFCGITAATTFFEHIDKATKIRSHRLSIGSTVITTYHKHE